MRVMCNCKKNNSSKQKQMIVKKIEEAEKRIKVLEEKLLLETRKMEESIDQFLIFKD